MDFWFYLLASICAYTTFQAFLNILRNKKLPPSPPTIPFLGNIFWLLKSSKNFADLEPVLRSLRSKYGDIVTIYIGSKPSIFITSHEAAHRALVKSGNVFASRPMALQTIQIFFPNQCSVSTSPYGPIWRTLRQNFMQVIQPSRLKSYSACRKWALREFKRCVFSDIKSGNNKVVPVQDYINYTIYVLLSYMCFGERFDEETVKNIQRVQYNVIHNFIRFNVLNFLPFLNKILFRGLWNEVMGICHDRKHMLLPIIKARQVKKIKTNNKVGGGELQFEAYVDSLFDKKLPESGKELTDEELVSLCSEFMLGGTDTTATAWLWAMANIIKHQDIQEKLFDEIKKVVRHEEDVIEEEDLKKMPYLEAVVLETLRRHPPGHFMLPRAVTQDTVMDGYVIPKDAIVNFLVAEIGWDPNVWEDPMEFKPERFLRYGGEGDDDKFDIKGFREIKMMPFGAGRRICPAIDMAILHLKFFVANLVRDFRWTLEDGCEVDMSEKQTFTVVMKNPLRPCVSPRFT